MGRWHEQTFLQRRNTNDQQTHEKMLNITSGKHKSKPQWDTISHDSEWLKLRSWNNRCWWGCGEGGTLLHCRWECQLVQPHWNTVWSFLKKLKIELTLWPSNCTAWYLPKGYKYSDSKGHMDPNVYSSNVHNSQNKEKAQMSNDNEWIRRCGIIYTMKYYSTIKKIKSYLFQWGG